MLPTQLPIHNTQIGLVSPAKDKGTPRRMDVNQFPSHGSLGAVNGDLLLDVIDLLDIEHRISRGKRRPLAQNPPLRVQTQQPRLLPRLVLALAIPAAIAATAHEHLGLAHPHGRIASIPPNVPSGRHPRPQRKQRTLLPVKVRESREDPRRRAGHAVVHPPADIVGRGRGGRPIADGAGAAVERPVGGGRLGLALVLVLGGGEFEADAEERAGVDFARGGELAPAAGPCVSVSGGLGCGCAVVRV